MRTDRRTIKEKEHLSPKDSAIESADEFTQRATKAEVLFALCDIMGVLGRDLAGETGVTKAQISHYRQGLTEIPAARMELILNALQDAIGGAEEQLKSFEKKSIPKASNPKLARLIAENLACRIDLAKEILDVNTERLKAMSTQTKRRRRAK